MNINELQKTVRRYYGEEYNGEHYLYRFFDIFLELPAPNLKNYYKMLSEKEDFSVGGISYWSYCNYLVSQFNFSLRDLNQFYYFQILLPFILEDFQKFFMIVRKVTDLRIRYICIYCHI